MTDEVKSSLGLWVVVAVLLLAVVVVYTKDADRPLLLASRTSGDKFEIGVCTDGETIFGFGNRNIGRDVLPDFGCFDKTGKKIEAVVSFTNCQQRICGM